MIFSKKSTQNSIQIFSLNAENLFDNLHDDGKHDYDFLEKKGWTQSHINRRLKLIKKTIFYKNSRPDILAVQEIENENILKQLAKTLGYSKYIMTNSKDERGIDVGILYSDRKVNLISHRSIEVNHLVKENNATRDILEAVFKINDSVISIYVNHWPSQNNPASERFKIAAFLKNIMAGNSTLENHYSIALGDFNVIDQDEPHAFRSVLLNKQNLNFELRDIHTEFKKLNLDKKISLGTHFYKRGFRWNRLDRIFLDSKLLDENSSLKIDVGRYEIVSNKYNTKRKFTYHDKKHPAYGSIVRNIPLGYDLKSKRGVSDHFPLRIFLNY